MHLNELLKYRCTDHNQRLPSAQHQPTLVNGYSLAASEEHHQQVRVSIDWFLGSPGLIASRPPCSEREEQYPKELTV